MSSIMQSAGDDPTTAVGLVSSINMACQVAVRWGGGQSASTTLPGVFGNPGPATATLTFGGPAIGTSCWMVAIGSDNEHESGDNFNFGDQNVSYELSAGSVLENWVWNRTS
jgi:hypothetical protein